VPGRRGRRRVHRRDGDRRGTRTRGAAHGPLRSVSAARGGALARRSGAAARRLVGAGRDAPGRRRRARSRGARGGRARRPLCPSLARRRGGPRRGLRGLRPGARPPHRRQAPAFRARRRSRWRRPDRGRAGAPPPRSPSAGQAVASPRRHRPRRGHPRRARVHRDGVRGGTDAPPLVRDAAARVAPDRRGLLRGGPGPARRPRRGSRASRLQAGQRPHATRRSRVRHRLRSGAHGLGRAGRGIAPDGRPRVGGSRNVDADERVRGDAGVHGAGAVRGRSGGRALRPVRVRRGSLRGALRRAPLRRRDAGRAVGERGAGRAARRDGSRGGARVGATRGVARALGRSGAALSVDARVPRRVAGAGAAESRAVRRGGGRRSGRGPRRRRAHGSRAATRSPRRLPRRRREDGLRVGRPAAGGRRAGVRGERARLRRQRVADRRPDARRLFARLGRRIHRRVRGDAHPRRTVRADARLADDVPRAAKKGRRRAGRRLRPRGPRRRDAIGDRGDGLGLRRHLQRRAPPISAQSAAVVPRGARRGRRAPDAARAGPRREGGARSPSAGRATSRGACRP
jgi:hypothetical protein